MESKLPDPEAPEQTAISVGDLQRMCREAAAKMGKKNKNRNLLMNCQYALGQLVDRLAKYEGQVQ